MAATGVAAAVPGAVPCCAGAAAAGVMVLVWPVRLVTVTVFVTLLTTTVLCTLL
jgi:hypothetical protein